MLVVDDGIPDAASVDDFRLDLAVASLYADLSVDPLLHRLLTHSRRLLDTAAGSVSLVDPVRGRYEKRAEDGVACQVGRSFPLDEGATGQAVNRRMPVVIDDYGDLRAGHLPPGHPAARGAAAAVPLWWRGEVIGVNVAFAGRQRRFTTAEIDALELLTQSVAPALASAVNATSVPSLAALLREHGRVGAEHLGVHTVVTEVGALRPVPQTVASTAADLVALARQVAAARSSFARLHVAVVHRAEGLRLLVQDEAAEPLPPAADPFGLGTRSWDELAELTAGIRGAAIGVEHVPGWGTLLRADFPAADEPPAAESSPLTPREREVLALLAAGLTDREVAAHLVISPKTVEKHVGAVLRKTRMPSRTAAVAFALERGWLPGRSDSASTGAPPGRPGSAQQGDGGFTPYRRVRPIR